MEQSHRFFLISWLLIPVVLVWLSTNYLIGLNRKTEWQSSKDTSTVENFSEIVEAREEETPKEIEQYKWNGEGLLSLSFDDAWSSQYAIGFPLLKEMDYKGVIAVPTQLIGMDGYMSWNQIKTLQNEGWEVASHTRRHSCEPKDLTEEFLKTELMGSKADLKKRGVHATNYVSPCGVVTPEIKKIAMDNYLSLRGTEGGYNPLPVADPYNLKIHAIEWSTTPEEVEDWISEAIKFKVWLIIVFHQIQNEESAYATTPEKFKKMMEIIKVSGIQVVHPTQALHLDISNSEEPTPATQTVMEVTIKSGNYVNIHPEKLVESATIGRMEKGKNYKVTAFEEEWVEIEFEADKKGWVLKSMTMEVL